MDRKTNQPRVLIIEQDDSLRRQIAEHLGNQYHTIEAISPDQGISLARENNPDLVISNSDGAESRVHFFKSLKQDDHLGHIPLLLITSRSDIADASVDTDNSADVYLKQPFYAEELLAHAENLIEVRQYLKKGGLEALSYDPGDTATRISDALFLESVQAVVEANLSNRFFGIEKMAEEVGVTPRELHQKLRTLTFLSPAGYIRTMRLQKAQELISEGNVTVEEAADQTGFHSVDYFRTLFKQTFGRLP